MIIGIDEPTHVVDANVVLAWSIDRPYSEQALALRSADHHLVAPDLIVHEVGSALAYYVRSDALTAGQAEDVYASVTAFVELVSGVNLRIDALRLSLSSGHPIYDCFYLALAARLAKPLVTADKKLASVSGKCGIDAVALS